MGPWGEGGNAPAKLTRQLFDFRISNDGCVCTVGIPAEQDSRQEDIIVALSCGALDGVAGKDQRQLKNQSSNVGLANT